MKKRLFGLHVQVYENLSNISFTRKTSFDNLGPIKNSDTTQGNNSESMSKIYLDREEVQKGPESKKQKTK